MNLDVILAMSMELFMIHFYFSSIIEKGIYTGCGKTRGCFGAPNGCIDQENCRFLASWKPQCENEQQTCDEESITKFRWEIMAKPETLGVLKKDDDFTWVALAFSKDKKLGDDLTFTCTNSPTGKEVCLFKNKSFWDFPIIL